MRYCLALDLKDDAEVVAEYVKWHQDVWPEVKRSITDSGITQMEIYGTGNRLFMIMETLDDFSFERKAEQDKNNATVMEWEDLMWNYQKALPWAKPGEKWVPMECIFKL